jgi:MYXO-CTERM domain-containing protein
MHRTFCSIILLGATFLVAPLSASGVTIQWSPVGNAGNAADSSPFTGHGAVGYSYNIGTYDVTNSQYVEFLNAKDSTGANPLGLYTSGPDGMSNGTYGGINFSAGNASGNKYSVISGNGNHPVNNVTWYDTIRFANWLNNGQGNGDTETGAYTLLGGTPTPSNGDSITRNAGAAVFLPSEDEWYKAAYNIPATNSYYQYPTSSNTAPIGSSPTALPNHANFQPDGPDNLTDVGAYTDTTSPYGAFDMGGNVYQWNESFFGISLRGLRGGSFFAYLNNGLQSSNEGGDDPWRVATNVGFRVASTVPEPSSLALAALGFIALAAWRLRRR